MEIHVPAEEYAANLETEKRIYENCTDVHQLPEIFHYWSNRYVRPKLSPLGFSDAPEMFRKYLGAQCREQPARARRFVSLGSGNCDLEIQLAQDLRAAGHREFMIDCVDVNAAMLVRARVAAGVAGVEDHLRFTDADLNAWTPGGEYDAVIASHSLHHVVKLENLFDAVKRSLLPNGRFIISDMIGRNGHQRWPEALGIVQEFWAKLPPSYRFHRVLKVYEEAFENRDCSVEGFEGIRSEDILPLLIDRFHFHMFVGFGNVIDPFVDRGFGPNFDPARAWDCKFIDEVQHRDEQELESGRLKPTHMLAVVSNQASAAQVGSQSPRQCVRDPEFVATAVPQSARAPEHWPHPVEEELQIACRRLAEVTPLVIERTEWALWLKNELQVRIRRLNNLEKSMDERTRWALDLERERIRLETQLRAYVKMARGLEAQVEERSTWALGLHSELEEQTRRAQAAELELQSYLHHPLRFLKRIARGIVRRLRGLL